MNHRDAAKRYLASELVRRTVQPKIAAADSLSMMPHVVGNGESIMGGALHHVLLSLRISHARRSQSDVVLIDGSEHDGHAALSGALAMLSDLRDGGHVGILLSRQGVTGPVYAGLRSELTRRCSLDYVEIEGPLAAVVLVRGRKYQRRVSVRVDGAEWLGADVEGGSDWTAQSLQGQLSGNPGQVRGATAPEKG